MMKEMPGVSSRGSEDERRVFGRRWEKGIPQGIERFLQKKTKGEKT